MPKNSDFMPFDANEYRAVVNPTNLVMQTWGYGRRIVLVPGELHNPKRAPIQFVKTRIARKAVKNQRRFLELMTVEQGMRLLNLARELNDFHGAYRKLTGKKGSKAAELLMESQERNALRRVLINELGVPDNVLANWSVGDMRAVIKDQTLVADLDANGRPRINDIVESEGGDLWEVAQRVQAETRQGAAKLFDEYNTIEGDQRLPSSEDRVGEGGLPGDFFVPETLGDEPTVEEIASRSTAEFDAETGGEVQGEAPPTVAAQEKLFTGMATTTVEAVVEEKDLEEPLPEPDMSKAEPSYKSDQEEVLALREQVERLGGKWHGRSGADRLRNQRDELVARQVTAAGV
jgi:hypothetical protein